jgi:hypothetical protein
MPRRPQIQPLNIPPEGLTRIRPGIHCSATTDTGAELEGLERMQIDHFLNTLAEIALAVASRQAFSTGGKVE